MSASEQTEWKVQALAHLRRAVIKIGSSLLSDERGIRRERLRALVGEIAALQDRGVDVVVVTSGAVTAGNARLGRRVAPRNMPQRQAAAAIGQIELMALYEEYFAQAGKRVAQVLLTHDDLASRRRYLNAKHTLEALLQARVIPVANENDTVAIEELNFGDNDNLSALVATLVEADLLVILSDVAGVFSSDPRTDASAALLPVWRADGDVPVSFAGSSGTPFGTGGMAAKLAAARKASAAGIATIIADGQHEGVLPQIFDSTRSVGTLIPPAGDRLARRKHWIAYTLRPAGGLVLDDGAHAAVRDSGRSLLASGIREVRGRFDSGECVSCLTLAGREFARGLVNYSAAEIDKIKGEHSNRIEAILGYKIGDAVIHRDDLALLDSPG